MGDPIKSSNLPGFRIPYGVFEVRILRNHLLTSFPISVFFEAFSVAAPLLNYHTFTNSI